MYLNIFIFHKQMLLSMLVKGHQIAFSEKQTLRKNLTAFFCFPYFFRVFFTPFILCLFPPSVYIITHTY